MCNSALGLQMHLRLNYLSTRIDIPRNAAERRVCFEKLDNFGCGSLWRIWFLSTPDLLSSGGSFAVFFLCSTHHSSPLIFHFHGRSFGKSERIDFVSYYLPYPTLVFVRKCRGNFTLDCFNIFFRLFENNCPFRRCKVWFSGALCRGRSKILCHVSPLARASQKITQRLDYHNGNCLDSELAFG